MQKLWTFHLSLNVASIPRAIEFYRVLFDMEPAKCHDDYAKFEVVDPPVVFSLVPHAVGANGLRSHVGIQLQSQEQLHLLRSRLIARNVAVKSSECGKSTYTFADPDGNAWQLSVGDHLPDGAPPTSAPPSIENKSEAATVWEHYVTADLPERVPHDHGTLDEIRLTGSFNGAHHDDARMRLVADAFRALKPGGKVVVHALAADQPLNEMPQLPGLAAMVSHVPHHQEIVAILKEAGFTGLQFTKFDAKAWFEHDGVGMREVKILAWKSQAPNGSARLQVIYRGPFKEIRDDDGNAYPRGECVAVNSPTWMMLREGPQAASFVFVEGDKSQTCQIEPTDQPRGGVQS